MFHTTWFVVSLLTQLAALLILRTHLPAWKSRPSRLLAGAAAMVAAIAVAMPYAFFAGELGFVPLPAHLLLGGLAIVVLYAVVIEWTKRRFFSWRAGRAS